MNNEGSPAGLKIYIQREALHHYSLFIIRYYLLFISGGVVLVYKDIRTALTAAGVAVYDPGQKIDVCTAPYAVVQESGVYPYAESNRLGYALIEVHCYAPLNHYAALDELLGRVMAALAPLAPDLRPTGNEGVHGINEKFRAHEAAVEYMIQKRLL